MRLDLEICPWQPPCTYLIGATMPKTPPGPKNMSSVMYKSQFEHCTQ